MIVIIKYRNTEMARREKWNEIDFASLCSEMCHGIHLTWVLRSPHFVRIFTINFVFVFFEMHTHTDTHTHHNCVDMWLLSDLKSSAKLHHVNVIYFILCHLSDVSEKWRVFDLSKCWIFISWTTTGFFFYLDKTVDCKVSLKYGNIPVNSIAWFRL